MQRKRIQFRRQLTEFIYGFGPENILALEFYASERNVGRLLALAVRRACARENVEGRSRYRVLYYVHGRHFWGVQAAQLSAEGGVTGYLDLGGRCADLEEARKRLGSPRLLCARPVAYPTPSGRRTVARERFRRRVYQKPASRLPF